MANALSGHLRGLDILPDLIAGRPEGLKRPFRPAIRPVHANAIWRKDGFSGIVTGNLPRKPPMPSLTTHRTLVLAAVMAANFMIAIEATIVSTAIDRKSVV